MLSASANKAISSLVIFPPRGSTLDKVPLLIKARQATISCSCSIPALS